MSKIKVAKPNFKVKHPYGYLIRSIMLGFVLVCSSFLGLFTGGLLNSVNAATSGSWSEITYANGFNRGTGTENDPFIITTGDQLVYLSKYVASNNGASGKYFELGADIDLSSKYWKEPDTVDVGSYIGTQEVPFAGNFDGRGYKIKGLKIDNHSKRDLSYGMGLFGYVKGSSSEVATIKNLVIEDPYVVADCSGGDAEWNAGALAGYVENAVIINVITTNTVNEGLYNSEIGVFTPDADFSYGNTLGGLIGKVNSYVEIVGCANKVTVVGYANPTGGLVGEIAANATSVNINACFNYAPVLAYYYNLDGKYGGIVGNVGVNTSNVWIELCANYGRVQNKEFAIKADVSPYRYNFGGIVGGVQSIVEIDHCINTNFAGVYVDDDDGTSGKTSDQVEFGGWGIAENYMSSFGHLYYGIAGRESYSPMIDDIVALANYTTDFSHLLQYCDGWADGALGYPTDNSATFIEATTDKTELATIISRTTYKPAMPAVYSCDDYTNLEDFGAHVRAIIIDDSGLEGGIRIVDYEGGLGYYGQVEDNEWDYYLPGNTTVALKYEPVLYFRPNSFTGRYKYTIEAYFPNGERRKVAEYYTSGSYTGKQFIPIDVTRNCHYYVSFTPALEGSGTYLDPYLIRTAEEFSIIWDDYCTPVINEKTGEYSSASDGVYFEQVNNITLNPLDIRTNGSADTVFAGYYNGGGYTITLATPIYYGYADYTEKTSLFETNNGLITNLYINFPDYGGSRFCLYSSESWVEEGEKGDYVGLMNPVGFVVGTNAGTIENVKIKDDQLFRTADLMEFGSIAGVNTSTGVIENCGSTISIDFDFPGGFLGMVNPGVNMGGIVGTNYGRVDGNFYLGSIGSESTEQTMFGIWRIGGIVGKTYSMNYDYTPDDSDAVVNNYFGGSLLGVSHGEAVGFTIEAYVGGIVGDIGYEYNKTSPFIAYNVVNMTEFGEDVYNAVGLSVIAPECEAYINLNFSESLAEYDEKGNQANHLVHDYTEYQALGSSTYMFDMEKWAWVDNNENTADYPYHNFPTDEGKAGMLYLKNMLFSDYATDWLDVGRTWYDYYMSNGGATHGVDYVAVETEDGYPYFEIYTPLGLQCICDERLGSDGEVILDIKNDMDFYGFVWDAASGDSTPFINYNPDTGIINEGVYRTLSNLYMRSDSCYYMTYYMTSSLGSYIGFLPRVGGLEAHYLTFDNPSIYINDEAKANNVGILVGEHTGLSAFEELYIDHVNINGGHITIDNLYDSVITQVDSSYNHNIGLVYGSVTGYSEVYDVRVQAYGAEQDQIYFDDVYTNTPSSEIKVSGLNLLSELNIGILGGAGGSTLDDNYLAAHIDISNAHALNDKYLGESSIAVGGVIGIYEKGYNDIGYSVVYLNVAGLNVNEGLRHDVTVNYGGAVGVITPNSSTIAIYGNYFNSKINSGTGGDNKSTSVYNIGGLIGWGSNQDDNFAFNNIVTGSITIDNSNGGTHNIGSLIGYNEHFSIDLDNIIFAITLPSSGYNTSTYNLIGFIGMGGINLGHGVIIDASNSRISTDANYADHANEGLYILGSNALKALNTASTILVEGEDRRIFDEFKFSNSSTYINANLFWCNNPVYYDATFIPGVVYEATPWLTYGSTRISLYGLMNNAEWLHVNNTTSSVSVVKNGLLTLYNYDMSYFSAGDTITMVNTNPNGVMVSLGLGNNNTSISKYFVENCVDETFTYTFTDSSFGDYTYYLNVISSIRTYYFGVLLPNAIDTKELEVTGATFVGTLAEAGIIAHAGDPEPEETVWPDGVTLYYFSTTYNSNITIVIGGNTLDYSEYVRIKINTPYSPATQLFTYSNSSITYEKCSTEEYVTEVDSNGTSYSISFTANEYVISSSYTSGSLIGFKVDATWLSNVETTEYAQFTTNAGSGDNTYTGLFLAPGKQVTLNYRDIPTGYQAKGFAVSTDAGQTWTELDSNFYTINEYEDVWFKGIVEVQKHTLTVNWDAEYWQDNHDPFFINSTHRVFVGTATNDSAFNTNNHFGTGTQITVNHGENAYIYVSVDGTSYQFESGSLTTSANTTAVTPNANKIITVNVTSDATLDIKIDQIQWGDEGIRANSFAGGSGTQLDPFIISTAEQYGYFTYYANTEEGATKHYRLNNDIDLKDHYAESIARLYGTFDGAGYTIHELTNMTDSLSAFIDNNYGTIQNVVFEDLSIYRNLKIRQMVIETNTYARAGMITYSNVGTIKNVINKSGIAGGNSAANSGGVDYIGYNAAYYLGNYVNDDIPDDSSLTYNICGFAHINSYIIENCASINISASFRHGSNCLFVSSNYGRIENSYAVQVGAWWTPVVFAYDQYARSSTLANANIKAGIVNCYFSTRPTDTGASSVQALVWRLSGGTTDTVEIKNVYYRTGSLARGPIVDQKTYSSLVTNLTELSAEQMKDIANYNGFDFGRVWKFVDSSEDTWNSQKNYGYPLLALWNTDGMVTVTVEYYKHNSFSLSSSANVGWEFDENSYMVYTGQSFIFDLTPDANLTTYLQRIVVNGTTLKSIQDVDADGAATTGYTGLSSGTISGAGTIQAYFVTPSVSTNTSNRYDTVGDRTYTASSINDTITFNYSLEDRYGPIYLEALKIKTTNTVSGSVISEETITGLINETTAQTITINGQTITVTPTVAGRSGTITVTGITEDIEITYDYSVKVQFNLSGNLPNVNDVQYSIYPTLESIEEFKPLTSLGYNNEIITFDFSEFYEGDCETLLVYFPPVSETNNYLVNYLNVNGARCYTNTDDTLASIDGLFYYVTDVKHDISLLETSNAIATVELNFKYNSYKYTIKLNSVNAVTTPEKVWVSGPENGVETTKNFSSVAEGQTVEYNVTYNSTPQFTFGYEGGGTYRFVVAGYTSNAGALSYDAVASTQNVTIEIELIQRFSVGGLQTQYINTGDFATQYTAKPTEKVEIIQNPDFNQNYIDSAAAVQGTFVDLGGTVIYTANLEGKASGRYDILLSEIYEFNGWTSGMSVVSTDVSYTITNVSAIVPILTPNYTLKTYEVTVDTTNTPDGESFLDEWVGNVRVYKFNAETDSFDLNVHLAPDVYPNSPIGNTLNSEGKYFARYNGITDGVRSYTVTAGEYIAVVRGDGLNDKLASITHTPSNYAFTLYYESNGVTMGGMHGFVRESVDFRFTYYPMVILNAGEEVSVTSVRAYELQSSGELLGGSIVYEKSDKEMSNWIHDKNNSNIFEVTDYLRLTYIINKTKLTGLDWVGFKIGDSYYTSITAGTVIGDLTVYGISKVDNGDNTEFALIVKPSEMDVSEGDNIEEINLQFYIAFTEKTATLTVEGYDSTAFSSLALSESASDTNLTFISVASNDSKPDEFTIGYYGYYKLTSRLNIPYSISKELYSATNLALYEHNASLGDINIGNGYSSARQYSQRFSMYGSVYGYNETASIIVNLERFYKVTLPSDLRTMLTLTGISGTHETMVSGAWNGTDYVVKFDYIKSGLTTTTYENVATVTLSGFVENEIFYVKQGTPFTVIASVGTGISHNKTTINGVEVANGDRYYPTADITSIVVNYIENVYTVTMVDSLGGPITGSANQTEFTLGFFGKANIVASTYTDKLFTQWSAEGDVVIANYASSSTTITEPTENISITAMFEQLYTVLTQVSTLYYTEGYDDLVGGTFTITPEGGEANYYAEGTVFNLSYTVTSVNGDKSHHFEDYYISTDGGSTWTNVGKISTYTLTNANTIIRAHFFENSAFLYYNRAKDTEGNYIHDVEIVSSNAKEGWGNLYYPVIITNNTVSIHTRNYSANKLTLYVNNGKLYTDSAYTTEFADINYYISGSYAYFERIFVGYFTEITLKVTNVVDGYRFGYWNTNTSLGVPSYVVVNGDEITLSKFTSYDEITPVFFAERTIDIKYNHLRYYSSSTATIDTPNLIDIKNVNDEVWYVYNDAVITVASPTLSFEITGTGSTATAKLTVESSGQTLYINNGKLYEDSTYTTEYTDGTYTIIGNTISLNGLVYNIINDQITVGGSVVTVRLYVRDVNGKLSANGITLSGTHTFNEVKTPNGNSYTNLPISDSAYNYISGNGNDVAGYEFTFIANNTSVGENSDNVISLISIPYKDVGVAQNPTTNNDAVYYVNSQGQEDVTVKEGSSVTIVANDDTAETTETKAYKFTGWTFDGVEWMTTEQKASHSVAFDVYNNRAGVYTANYAYAYKLNTAVAVYNATTGTYEIMDAAGEIIRSGGDMYADQTYLTGKEVTLTTAANTGFVFKGWYALQNGTYTSLNNTDLTQVVTSGENFETTTYVAVYEKVIIITLATNPNYALSGKADVEYDVEAITGEIISEGWGLLGEGDSYKVFVTNGTQLRVEVLICDNTAYNRLFGTTLGTFTLDENTHGFGGIDDYAVAGNVVYTATEDATILFNYVRTYIYYEVDIWVQYYTEGMSGEPYTNLTDVEFIASNITGDNTGFIFDGYTRYDAGTKFTYSFTLKDGYAFSKTELHGYTVTGNLYEIEADVIEADQGANYFTFQEITYSVTFANEPGMAGTVTGVTDCYVKDGYDYSKVGYFGTVSNVTAIANTGYRFTGWTTSGNATFNGEDAVIQGATNVRSNITFTANYTSITGFTYKTYNLVTGAENEINVSANYAWVNSTTGGSGNGTVNVSANESLSENLLPTDWTYEEEYIKREFGKVTAKTELTASYLYGLTTSPINLTLPAGTYTFNATSDTFTGIYVVVSDDIGAVTNWVNGQTVTFFKDIKVQSIRCNETTLYAGQYTWTALINKVNVSNLITLDNGSEVTLTANDVNGYVFKYWAINSEDGLLQVSPDKVYTFVIDQTTSGTYYAVYNPTYSLTLTAETAGVADDFTGGSMTYNFNATDTTINTKTVVSNVEHGSAYVLTAYTNNEYRFAGWYNGDTLLSEDDIYTLSVTENITVTAKFVRTYTVTIDIKNGLGDILFDAHTQYYAYNDYAKLYVHVYTEEDGWDYLEILEIGDDKVWVSVDAGNIIKLEITDLNDECKFIKFVKNADTFDYTTSTDGDIEFTDYSSYYESDEITITEDTSFTAVIVKTASINFLTEPSGQGNTIAIWQNSFVNYDNVYTTMENRRISDTDGSLYNATAYQDGIAMEFTTTTVAGYTKLEWYLDDTAMQTVENPSGTQSFTLDAEYVSGTHTVYAKFSGGMDITVNNVGLGSFYLGTEQTGMPNKASVNTVSVEAGATSISFIPNTSYVGYVNTKIYVKESGADDSTYTLLTTTVDTPYTYTFVAGFVPEFKMVYTTTTWIDKDQNGNYLYATAPSGAGTLTSPYIISTPANLAWISGESVYNNNTFDNTYIKFENDIDLSGKVWVAIQNFNGLMIGNLNKTVIDGYTKAYEVKPTYIFGINVFGAQDYINGYTGEFTSPISFIANVNGGVFKNVGVELETAEDLTVSHGEGDVAKYTNMIYNEAIFYEPISGTNGGYIGISNESYYFFDNAPNKYYEDNTVKAPVTSGNTAFIASGSDFLYVYYNEFNMPGITNYVLTTNITLPDYTDRDGDPESWNSMVLPEGITFDGRGYTLDTTTGDKVENVFEGNGFFSNIYGTLKNINLRVNVENHIGGYENYGLVAGVVEESGIVENITISGLLDLYHTGINTENIKIGIFGEVKGTVRNVLSDCGSYVEKEDVYSYTGSRIIYINYNKVTAGTNYEPYVGLIAGAVTGNGLIEQTGIGAKLSVNMASEGSDIETTNVRGGGLVGYANGTSANSAIVSNSYAQGTVNINGTNNFAPIVHTATNFKVEKSYVAISLNPISTVSIAVNSTDCSYTDIAVSSITTTATVGDVVKQNSAMLNPDAVNTIYTNFDFVNVWSSDNMSSDNVSADLMLGGYPSLRNTGPVQIITIKVTGNPNGATVTLADIYEKDDSVEYILNTTINAEYEEVIKLPITVENGAHALKFTVTVADENVSTLASFKYDGTEKLADYSLYSTSKQQKISTYSVSFVYEADHTFEVHIEDLEYSVHTVSADANMGTTSGDGTFGYGEEVTLTATPNNPENYAGYELLGWRKYNRMNFIEAFPNRNSTVNYQGQTLTYSGNARYPALYVGNYNYTAANTLLKQGGTYRISANVDLFKYETSYSAYSTLEVVVTYTDQSSRFFYSDKLVTGSNVSVTFTLDSSKTVSMISFRPATIMESDSSSTAAERTVVLSNLILEEVVKTGDFITNDDVYTINGNTLTFSASDATQGTYEAVFGKTYMAETSGKCEDGDCDVTITDVNGENTNGVYVTENTNVFLTVTPADGQQVENIKLGETVVYNRNTGVINGYTFENNVLTFALNANTKGQYIVECSSISYDVTFNVTDLGLTASDYYEEIKVYEDNTLVGTFTGEESGMVTVLGDTSLKLEIKTQRAFKLDYVNGLTDGIEVNTYTDADGYVRYLYTYTYGVVNDNTTLNVLFGGDYWFSPIDLNRTNEDHTLEFVTANGGNATYEVNNNTSYVTFPKETAGVGKGYAMENPIIITTAEQLARVAYLTTTDAYFTAYSTATRIVSVQYRNAYYEIANDIDLGNYLWNPINGGKATIGGEVNVNINNMYIFYSDEMLQYASENDLTVDMAFISTTQSNSNGMPANIHNMTFNNAKVVNNYNKNANYAAVVIGKAREHTNISDVHVTNSYVKGYLSAGFAGQLYFGVTVTNSSVTNTQVMAANDATNASVVSGFANLLYDTALENIYVNTTLGRENTTDKLTNISGLFDSTYTGIYTFANVIVNNEYLNQNTNTYEFCNNVVAADNDLRFENVYFKNNSTYRDYSKILASTLFTGNVMPELYLPSTVTKETFDFDYDNIWYWDSSLNMPQLRKISNVSSETTIAYKEVATGTLNGEGTEQNPYLIEDVDDLYLLSHLINTNAEGYNNVDVYYKLTADLDLKGNIFTPIGLASNPETNVEDNNYAFKANFDGDYHTISNIYINNKVYRYSGLFGYVYSGNAQTVEGAKHSVIKNINIENMLNFSVTSKYKAGLVGAIIGRVENVNVNARLYHRSEVNAVGGVVGYLNYANSTEYNTITNAKFSGYIGTQDNIAGGIVGVIEVNNVNSYEYNITKSINEGDILTSSVGGGVLGGTSLYSGASFKILVQDCVNSGHLYVYLPSSTAGGIVGRASGLTLQRCYNNGDITTGGATQSGSDKSTDPNWSSSDGSVGWSLTAGAYVGELVGRLYNGTYENIIAGSYFNTDKHIYLTSTNTLIPLGNANIIGNTPTGISSWSYTTSNYITYTQGNYSGAGTKYTTSQLQNQSNFIGYNFNTTWGIYAGVNNDMPTLKFYNEHKVYVSMEDLELEVDGNVITSSDGIITGSHYFNVDSSGKVFAYVKGGESLVLTISAVDNTLIQAVGVSDYYDNQFAYENSGELELTYTLDMPSEVNDGETYKLVNVTFGVNNFSLTINNNITYVNGITVGENDCLNIVLLNTTTNKAYYAKATGTQIAFAEIQAGEYYLAVYTNAFFNVTSVTSESGINLEQAEFYYTFTLSNETAVDAIINLTATKANDYWIYSIVNL